MDKRFSIARNRSKSVAADQRSSSIVPIFQHSVGQHSVLTSEKDSNTLVDFRKKHSLETNDDLLTFGTLSAFQMEKDDPKYDLEASVSISAKNRLVHHRFSLDVRGQIPLKREQDEIANYKKSRHNSMFGTLQPITSFSFYKKNVFDLEKTKAKILDPKKDSVSRMRYMKLLSDKCSLHEIEDFYKKYYTFIYHTIHEHMKTAENLQAKQGAASSKQSEAKELAVSIFEVLLCWIPNVINKKWQYHSIVSVIRNMLQADILSKTFSDGLKLFIMWYSILMENAEENEHMLFSRLFMSHDGSNDLFKFNLLLKVIVTEMKKIYWDEQISSYTFVFRKLEVCYMRRVFPHYQRIDYSSFQPESLGDVPLHSEGGLPNHRQMLVDWLSAVVGSNKRTHSMNREKFGIIAEEFLEKVDAEISADSRPRTHSSELVAKNLEGPTPSQGKKFQDNKHEFLFGAEERLSMQRILFSNKSVVNMVLEIFRQSFTGTFGRSKLAREVCLIYKLWLKEQQSPAFLRQSLQNSSKSACSTSEKTQSLCSEDFKIGKQQFIRVFICQSCAIFFGNWKSLDGLDQNASLYGITQEQTKVCSQVLNLYRYLIMDAEMETETWTCLLEKLMKICKHIVVLPAEGFGFLEELGKKLVETLLVAFVRSSLNGLVTRKLWDDLTSLMKSMTNVDSVVQQWGSIMVMLTKMLGHSIYNVDLVSSSSDVKKQRKKLKNPNVRDIHFREDADAKGAKEISKIEKDVEKESDLADESISSIVSTSADNLNKDDSFKDADKTLDSIESFNPPPENNSDSTLRVSDAETPTDINDDDRGSPPSSSYVDDSPTETADPGKDARSSLDRSESSGSLENSLSVGLSARGEFDDNETRPDCTETLERSCDESPEGTEAITRETSVEDKQVEVDLNEIKECSLGEEGLMFVWLKMLAIFGSVKEKADCHRYLVVDNLKPIHDCLLKIYKHRDFIGEDTFPILVLIPWLLQIIHTHQQLLQNKLIAYSMIGDYMLHVPLPPHYLNRFYFSIHLALQSPVKDISHAIIRHYSKQIFGHHLHRGIIILLEDFIKVALNIICKGEELVASHIPDKIEASRLLALSVSIPNHYHNLKVLDPDSSQVQLKTCDTDNLKDRVINALVSSVDNHQGLSGVCSIGICGLGIFLHEEILRNANNKLIPRVVGCLLSVFAKDVSSSNHGNIDKLLACQSLSALRDHHHLLLLTNNLKDTLRLILQTLLGYVYRSLVTEDLVNELKVIHSIVYCLLDWFLVLPVSFLMEEVNGLRLLDHFLEILVEVNCKCRSDRGKMHENTKSIFHLRLFINFVYCHLVNYIGCHHEETSTESHPWHLMAWFGTRIFEATCSLKDIHNPLLSADLLEFPIYLITLRDVTGKWQWFMQEANVLSRKYKLERSRLQDSNDLISPTLKRKSASDFSEDDEDILIKALNLIADTSPECFPNSEFHSLTLPLPCLKVDPVQDPLISSFVQQNKDIYEFLINSNEEISPCKRSLKNTSNGFFFNSGMLMKIGQSFGLLQFQGRDRLDFLNRGEQLMREIKHFDAQKCLETHKIGVFYIGPNQNDKIDILKNEKGSPIFEEFCSQLGDLVNLRHHKGFLGGLSTSGSTGEVAPYYSPSSVLQVMFHVSTLLGPSQADGSNEDVCVTKMRHLGNDEVHIVWMDNGKCYSPDIIATKFGEVTIIIYPLPRLLFRIQIIKKIMMDTFGPLFDGSIVGWTNLAALVRATAINAGRAIRETRDFYLKFYEERYATLLKIVNTYKKQETYEQFLCSAMLPGVREMGPISYLSTETRDNADLAQTTPAKPERRIRMDAATNKKRSEFALPLKTKSERRSEDMK